MLHGSNTRAWEVEAGAAQETHLHFLTHLIATLLLPIMQAAAADASARAATFSGRRLHTRCPFSDSELHLPPQLPLEMNSSSSSPSGK